MQMFQRDPVITVEEFSTPSPVTVRADRKIVEIAEIMEYFDFRHVPVVGGDGQPIGILSDRDIKVVADFEQMHSLVAADLMSPEPYIVAADTALEKVSLMMSKHKFGSAIIIYPEDDSLGIFTSTDALNALIELLRGDVGTLKGQQNEAGL